MFRDIRIGATGEIAAGTAQKAGGEGEDGLGVRMRCVEDGPGVILREGGDGGVAAFVAGGYG